MRHFNPNILAAVCQCGAPLSCTCFGYQPGGSLFHVVVCLWDGGVGFVASCWAELFAFEVDFCGSAEEFFKPFGAVKRAGSWEADVGVVDFVGDFDVAFLGDFLHDEFFGEDAHQFCWVYWFLVDWI